MSPNSLFSSSRMKLKAGFTFCSLLVIFSLLLVACGGTTATQSKTHTLVMAATNVQFSSAGFNPYNANANADLGGFIYEPLFFFDALTGQSTGLLGTSHDFNADGTQVTVHLRTGVKWNDGQPFSADDVVFTFNAMQQYPAADIWGANPLLKSVTKVDDNTVLFTFKAPAYVSFDTVGGSVYIIPKHVFSGLGDISKASIDGVHSVGTGPMMVEKWTPDLMTLKKNPGFYNAASVKVDIIKMPVYKDNDAFKVAMSSNAADWAGFFATGLQDSYVNPDPTHHHFYMAPVDMFGIFMDIRDNAQLADVNVRKAIAMGIDRTAWAVQGEDGLVPAVNQTGLLNIDGNKPYQLSQYQNLSTKADANSAKALLTQDGYTAGSDGVFAKNGQRLAFTLITVTGFTDWNAAAQAIQQNMKDIGIQITINSMQFSDYLTLRTGAGKYDLMQSGVGGGAHSAYDIYNGTLASTDFPPAGRNSSYWNDPATNALLSDLGSTADQAKQIADVQGLEKIMVDQVPWIPSVAGARWFEYSTQNYTGWPDQAHPYATGATYSTPDNEVILQHLVPTS